MSRAKTIDPPRHSIFDNLGEKYPEMAESSPAEPTRAKVSGLRVGFALVVFLGIGALGLYMWFGDSPSTPREVRGLSLPESSEPKQEPLSAPAKIQLPVPTPAPPIGTAEASVSAATIDSEPSPTDLAPQPALLASSQPLAEKPALNSDSQPALLAPSQPLAEKPALSVPEETSTLLGEKAAAECDAADLREPIKLYGPGPEYPEAARQAFQEGTVIVEAEVDDTGAVADVRTLRSATPELDLAAISAVTTWRFEPATCAGQPIAGRYRTALHFNLTPPKREEATADLTSGGGIVPPVKLFAPSPAYPPTEWVAAIEGDVQLKATIDEAGFVVAIEVVKSVSPGLDDAAVEALERWQFRPALRGGEPVRFDQVLTFRFRR